jgi:hypothetical protein
MLVLLVTFLVGISAWRLSKLRNVVWISKNIVYTYRLGWVPTLHVIIAVPTLHVLIAVPIKVQIFWVLTWYLLVKSSRYFGGPCCLHLHGARCTRRADFLNSEDGGRKLFRNVGNLESLYTTSYPIELQSWYTVLLKTPLLILIHCAAEDATAYLSV